MNLACKFTRHIQPVSSPIRANKKRGREKKKERREGERRREEGGREEACGPRAARGASSRGEKSCMDITCTLSLSALRQFCACLENKFLCAA